MTNAKFYRGRVRCSLSEQHVEFNPYLEFENNTGKRTKPAAVYVGLAVYFYFSMEKK